MPVSDVQKSWWRSPAAMAEYRDSAREITRRHGTSYLDAYDSLERQIPQAYFWDPSHLNLDGATVLTRRVSRQYLAPLLADG